MTAAANRSNGQQPIRILHLIPRDGIGGVEVAAKSMIDCCDGECEFQLLFIEREDVQGGGVGTVLRLLRDNLAAMKKAKTINPDVVICSLWRSIPLAIMLKLAIPRARLVFLVHNDVAMHRWDAGLSDIAIRRADQVWGDAAATLIARGVPAKRARVISFVIDRPPPMPLRRAEPATFVSWGRLHEQKGIDRSVQLIGLLAARGLDVRYEVYGPDGGELKNLEILVRELDLVDRVHFHGPVARGELPEIAGRHRYFLQLSRSEGMCMAAVEAMQLGLVPVATRVGEMARYVRPSETGICVDPDRLDIAVDELERLIGNGAAWRNMSECAAAHWQEAPLYSDDVCRAARALADRSPSTDLDW